MAKTDEKTLETLESIADSLARIARVLEEEAANGIGMSLAIIAKELRSDGAVGGRLLAMSDSVDLVAEAIRKATGQEPA